MKSFSQFIKTRILENESAATQLQPILFKISKAAGAGKLPFSMPRANLRALANDLEMSDLEFSVLQQLNLLKKMDDGTVVDQDRYNQIAKDLS